MGKFNCMESKQVLVFLSWEFAPFKTLKSFDRSKKTIFLNLISFLISMSWSCSRSCWILVNIKLTSSWEETGALFLICLPFSMHWYKSLSFTCSCARMSASASDSNFCFDKVLLCLWQSAFWGRMFYEFWTKFILNPSLARMVAAKIFITVWRALSNF